MPSSYPLDVRPLRLEMAYAGIWVIGFSVMVAVLSQMIWPHHSLASHLLLSLTIGLCYWLAILALTRLPEHLKPKGSGPLLGTPRGRRWVLILLGVNLLAIAVGMQLGGWLSGISMWPGRHQDWMGISFTLIFGLVGTKIFVTRSRNRALRLQLAESERDAVQARLRLLQAQLEPHMLFNTLANLRALVRIDAERAEQMIDQLNRFLRASLGASQRDAHSLDDEIARLSDYLALMQVRMGPRLAVGIDVPDELRTVPLPPLLLQPLVENAIRHGLEPQVQGGTIWLSACLVQDAGNGEQIEISVTDDGLGYADDAPDAKATMPPSLSPDGLHQGGLGLSHVRERLAHAYGEHATLHWAARQPHGTCVRVRLPLTGPNPPIAHHDNSFDCGR